MKKVGIITYPDIADGKGRFLQAYALYSYIESLGYEVEIIDYVKHVETSTKSRLSRMFRCLSFKAVSQYILKKWTRHKMSLIKEEREKQRNCYNEFISQNISISRRIDNLWELEEYARKFDAVICGSDQIWNPYFIGGDPVYYLQFVSERKRIAYAASLGTIEIDNDKLDQMADWIKEIKYASVREESARSLLNGKKGLDVKTVMDPTFLMQSEWWETLARKGKKEQEPYLLTLYFDNGSNPRKIAKRIKERYKLKEINIPENARDINNKEYLSKACLSPTEFASLFRNAEYIVTQSFHGVVLSILYRKKFFVLDRTSRLYVSGVFSRIRDLLEKLGLENRIITGKENIDEIDNEIDFSVVYEKLEVYAKKSRDFLRIALDDVCNSASVQLPGKYRCTGCEACVSVCTKGAIDYDVSYDGFYFPRIDYDRCSGCRKCEKVCPQINETSENLKEIELVYACASKSSEVKKESSSGGFFATLAMNVIDAKGSVYACVFDEYMNAIHQKAVKREDIRAQQKSKYVQSRIGRTYMDVKEDLENEKEVLFVGTPCQVAGLKSYLGKDYDKLLTCDFICHGVPAQMMLNKSIEYWEKKYKKKIKEYHMRTKRYGWSPIFRSKIVFEDDTERMLNVHKGDVYKNSFLNNLSLRNSCYSCQYSNSRRISDITMADFWGIGDDELKDANRAEGVSMICINSEKGRFLFDRIRDEILAEECEKVCIFKGQPAVKKHLSYNELRDEFIGIVMSEGIGRKVCKMAGQDEPRIKRIKRNIEKVLGKKVYSILKVVVKR